ncbi:MAG: ABC transporter permease [Acidimicrobiia bacterium]|nr:ABC transporter permease [Acidimicrobiia bacterium]
MSITRATAEQIGAPEYGAAALIDLAPGTSPAVLGDYSRSGELITPFRVARVRNLEQVGMLPFLLAAFAASVGLLAVGHGLWVSINARRRDLAVLATLGFRPQDIRTMLLWQATFIAIVGTLLGVTVGIILGTNAWSAVASSTAVIDQAVVPGVALVLIVGGTFLGCNLIALVAARGTRRTGTAQALQGE